MVRIPCLETSAALFVLGLPGIAAAFLAPSSSFRKPCRAAMSLHPEPSAIQIISSKTLDHYSQRAEDFWLGTKDHDVTQNREALLRNLRDLKTEGGERKTCFEILDLGCGPGRDIKAFSDLGHRVTGLDGCLEFVNMARAFCPTATVLHQDLHALNIGEQTFDGIFANAVLFHVHRPALPRVMGELRAALRPGGALFVSNPRAMDGADRESGGGGPPGADQRYGHYQTLESWRATCAAAGLVEVEHYYRPPGRPLEEQPWLASVWRRA